MWTTSTLSLEVISTEIIFEHAVVEGLMCSLKTKLTGGDTFGNCTNHIGTVKILWIHYIVKKWVDNY